MTDGVRSLVLVALVPACVDTTIPSGVNAESHVISFDHPALLPRKVDVLFAIDDSLAMTPYVERTRAVPAALVAGLARSMGALPDLRVGVVTGATPLGGYLADAQQVDGTRTANFSGDLADAIAAEINVGITGSSGPRLFDAVRSVIEANPGGFVRNRADLMLISLAANDDASSGFPPDYATEFEASKMTSDRTLAIGIYRTGATRLGQFHGALHHNPRITSIDAADYASAFASFECNGCSSLANACIAMPGDVDLKTSGDQFDCAISAIDDDNTEHLLRACTDDSPAPCWTIERDPVHCFGSQPAVVRIRGYAPPYRPHLRGQCVVF